MPAIPSRILPINRAKGGGGWVEGATNIPKAAMQSITMSIRAGDKQYALGYIQKFHWSVTRDVQFLHQLEAYPNGTFDSQSVWGAVGFSESNYWPGEAVEGVPGKQDGIEVELSRYALYTSNLLAALTRIDGAGTEDAVPISTNADVNDQTNRMVYVSLLQQVRPIDIHQIYYSPVDGTPIFGRRFEECWFTDFGETIPEAKENQPILEDGKMKATRIRPFDYTA